MHFLFSFIDCMCACMLQSLLANVLTSKLSRSPIFSFSFLRQLSYVAQVYLELAMAKGDVAWNPSPSAWEVLGLWACHIIAWLGICF